jgi:hypothetical protein
MFPYSHGTLERSLYQLTYILIRASTENRTLFSNIIFCSQLMSRHINHYTSAYLKSNRLP